MEKTEGCIVYVNANSLFDYTSGGAKSLNLILSAAAEWNIEVHAIHGSCTYSKETHTQIIDHWKEQKPSSTNPLVRHCINKRVRHTIIKTKNYERLSLTCLEQEIIYQCANTIINSCRNRHKNIIFLSWGNLLLENSLFKLANHLNIKTVFYLVNPHYRNKFSEGLIESKLIITDSLSTKKLYLSQCKQQIEVLPKLYGPCRLKVNGIKRHKQKRITLVNGTLEKGLEVFLKLANRFFESNSFEYKFLIVDSNKNLLNELNRINQDIKTIPKNVEIRGASKNTDDLLIDTSIVTLLSLWHESGSRLIHESHQRGIPILCFSTGGSKELCSPFPKDIFETPVVDNQLRIKNINIDSLYMRIKELLSNSDTYAKYSEKLIKKSQTEKDLNYRIFRNKLKTIISN